MQEIEFLLHFLLGLQILENGHIILNFHQIMLECAFYIEIFGYFRQGFGILGHTEHNTWCLNVLDIDGKILFSPSIGPEIENFLWSTCAFDGWGRFRKDCFAFFQLFSKPGCLFCML